MIVKDSNSHHRFFKLDNTFVRYRALKLITKELCRRITRYSVTCRPSPHQYCLQRNLNVVCHKFGQNETINFSNTTDNRREA